MWISLQLLFKLNKDIKYWRFFFVLFSAPRRQSHVCPWSPECLSHKTWLFPPSLFFCCRPRIKPLRIRSPYCRKAKKNRKKKKSLSLSVQPSVCVANVPLRLGRGCSRLRVSPSRCLRPHRRRSRSGVRWGGCPTWPHSGCRRRWPCPSAGRKHGKISWIHVVS